MAAVSKATLTENALKEEAALQALRLRAARQAAALKGKPEPVATAECRVLPMGDGRVSMGQHVGGIGEAYYEKAETFAVALPIAKDLEQRGYVEITNVIEPTPEAEAA